MYIKLNGYMCWHIFIEEGRLERGGANNITSVIDSVLDIKDYQDKVVGFVSDGAIKLKESNCIKTLQVFNYQITI